MRSEILIIYDVKGTRHDLTMYINLDDFYKWSPMRKVRHFQSIGVRTYGKHVDLNKVTVVKTGEVLYEKV